MSDDNPRLAAYWVQQTGKELRVQLMNLSRLRSECLSVEEALDVMAEGRLAVVAGSDMPELRRQFRERRLHGG